MLSIGVIILSTKVCSICDFCYPLRDEVIEMKRYGAIRGRLVATFSRELERKYCITSSYKPVALGTENCDAIWLKRLLKSLQKPIA